MNDTSTRSPDIEIYIDTTSTADIIDWLKTIYADIELVKTTGGGKTQHLTAGNPGNRQKTPILVVEDARDSFSCIWFQSGNTAWATDLDCAYSAGKYFSTEIRCSTGPWKEEPDSDEWYSVRGSSQHLISWPS